MSSTDAAKLREMGFAPSAVQQALSRQLGFEGALEWLIERGEREEMDEAPAGRHQEMEQCSICLEDLQVDEAVGRCTGTGGRRHYYHAQCLSGWVRQCRENQQAPSCPECRGPLQVRSQRLRDAGRRSSADERQVLEEIADAAREAQDYDGWSGIKAESLLTGAANAAGVAVGVGLLAVAAPGALVAVLHALVVADGALVAAEAFGAFDQRDGRRDGRGRSRR